MGPRAVSRFPIDKTFSGEEDEGQEIARPLVYSLQDRALWATHRLEIHRLKKRAVGY